MVPDNTSFFNSFIEAISFKVAEILKKELSLVKVFESTSDKDLLSPKEASLFLNQSIPTLNKLVRNKTLKKHYFPGTRRVYYLKSELIAVLKSNQI